ncbi:hypothetical protein D3C85_1476530 [compost metagenome]
MVLAFAVMISENGFMPSFLGAAAAAAGGVAGVVPLPFLGVFWAYTESVPATPSATIPAKASILKFFFMCNLKLVCLAIKRLKLKPCYKASTM